MMKSIFCSFLLFLAIAVAHFDELHDDKNYYEEKYYERWIIDESSSVYSFDDDQKEPCKGMVIETERNPITHELMHTAKIKGVRIPILSPRTVQVTASKFANLGEGAHGAITEGVYTSPWHNNLSIAIKHIPFTVQYSTALCELLEESRIMYTLYTNTSNTFSDYMVPFLGLVDAYSLNLPMNTAIVEDFPVRLHYPSSDYSCKDGKDSEGCRGYYVSTQPLRSPLALVMEKMLCTATEYIHHNGCRHAVRKSVLKDQALLNPSSLVSRLGIVQDISESLIILHDVIQASHGDIKGINILINKDGHAVLTDFSRFQYRSTDRKFYPGPKAVPSLSFIDHPEYMDRSLQNGSIFDTEDENVRIYPRIVSKLTLGNGNVYTDGFGAPETLYAPELNGPATASASSDVYALGITMWELFTKHLPEKGPYGYLPNFRLLDTAIMAGARPSLDKTIMINDIPDEVLHIMKHCWLHDRDLRLTSKEISVKIREILQRNYRRKI